MKKIILLIMLFVPFIANAQQDVKRVDISKDIRNSLKNVVSNHSNDISHYSLVNSLKKVNIVYAINDSINVVSLSQGKDAEHKLSPIVTADSIEKLLRTVYLPRRRTSDMLISSDSGKLTFAISNNEGKDWSNFKSYDYITTSPIIYIHHNKLAGNQLIAYFLGNGNLTASDTNGKSMLFMIISNDGGKSWLEPRVALKHNLYSLNNASIAFYSGRNNKKNELFMVCTSKDTKSLFLSTSNNNGIEWSYPIELPFLNNTANHILSINKNNISLLFTDSDKNNMDSYGDIFTIMTSIKNIKNQKMKGIMYRIHNYSIQEEIDMISHHELNHTMGGILFKPRHLLFTISSPLKDGTPSSINATIINVSKRRSKSL